MGFNGKPPMGRVPPKLPVLPPPKKPLTEAEKEQLRLRREVVVEQREPDLIDTAVSVGLWGLVLGWWD